MTNTGSRRHVGLMLTLGLMLGHAAPGIAAAGPDGGFRIMSDEEIAAHREAMATLEGAAREEYRNTQYLELRARAEQHGFSLPATPPWATKAEPAPVPGDTAAEHAAMREKLAAHKAQAAQTGPAETAALAADPAGDSAQPQPADTPPPPVPVPATAPIAHEQAAVAASAATAAPAAPAASVDATAAAASPPVALQPPVTAVAVPTVPPQPPAPPAASAPPTAAGYSNEAMAAYREEMRARFDSYLQERQAQQQEAIRRQREHIEASREINRGRMPTYNRPAPPPYPIAPGYGPRYPGAYPGYRTPYWQQPE